MVNFFAGVAATFVTIPLLGFILVYLISRLILKNSQKSFFLSVDISTVFFLFAVHYLLLVMVGKSMLWVIILILLLSIAFFGIVSWRKNNEIQIARVLRKFWRFAFLVSSFAYFLLLLIGLLHRIFTSTIN